MGASALAVKFGKTWLWSGVPSRQVLLVTSEPQNLIHVCVAVALPLRELLHGSMQVFACNVKMQEEKYAAVLCYRSHVNARRLTGVVAPSIIQLGKWTKT